MNIHYNKSEAGFTLVEVVIASVIFPMIVIFIATAFNGLTQSYIVSKQLNEMYAVLSACPEIDRALQYDSISESTNCYPNNTFKVEGVGSGTITYEPTLTVTNTGDLPINDTLREVPDSKVIDISTEYRNSSAPALELRMLITRNGIGQL